MPKKCIILIILIIINKLFYNDKKLLTCIYIFKNSNLLNTFQTHYCMCFVIIFYGKKEIILYFKQIKLEIN